MDDTEPTEVAAREPAKKSKVGTGIAVVLVAGIAAAAGIFGGKLLGKEEHHEAKTEEAEPSGSSDAPPHESVPMPQVIVDVRDKDGEVHHLKVGLQFETNPLPEEEFAKCLPRGREAVVEYLRGLSFESATDPKAFEKIKTEIGERTKQALGKSRVHRVIITDFVAQ